MSGSLRSRLFSPASAVAATVVQDQRAATKATVKAVRPVETGRTVVPVTPAANRARAKKEAKDKAVRKAVVAAARPADKARRARVPAAVVAVE